jgi:NitT/TauT family transport system substrate-binding protein
MSANIWPIRSAATAAILGLALASTTASAADKVTFLTSWFAQAEHGGFYQAKATGLYEKAGLDVTLKMGGPQVNAAQLLLAGETDFMMGYDLQVLKMLEQGHPVITVATSFQFDLQGIMAHDNVSGLADLKDKTILVATAGRTTWWPWLKANSTTATNRPSRTRSTCNPSSSTKTWCNSPIRRPSRIRPSSRACRSSSSCLRATAIRPTARPWSPRAASSTEARTSPRASLRHRSKAGGATWPIRRRATLPKMSDDQIAFGIEQLKALKALDGGDAQTMGIGIITQARWNATYDFMVSAGLLKPEVDWKQGFTDRFVKTLKLSM